MAQSGQEDSQREERQAGNCHRLTFNSSYSLPPPTPEVTLRLSTAPDCRRLSEDWKTSD